MKLNKTIIISDILSILIAFILFIIIFIEMKCVAIIYDRVVNNLFIRDFNPIQKITLDRNVCQEPGMYSLVNYTFPGIDDNCFNSETNEFDNKKEQCSKKSDKLISVKKIDQTNFTIWRNKIICAKYFEYDNSSSFYYKFLEYDEKADCGEGFTKCGDFNREAFTENKGHKILCVKDTIECPINFIEITDDISRYEGVKEYDIFSFENGRYLVTSNKFTNLSIITKIKIAEGEYPCIERGYYSNNTVQFPSMKNINKFNCSSKNIDDSTSDDKDDEEKANLRILNDNNNKSLLIDEGFDTRFISFDTYSKYDFLKDNDYNYLYSQLPNISIWKQDIYTGSFHLFYQTSFISKDDCKEFDDVESKIIRLKKVQASRVVFALAHILIYVVLFSILGLIKVIMAWRHSLLFGIKVFLSFIILIANIVLIKSSKNDTKVLYGFDKSIKNCLDDVSYAILRNHDINKILKNLEDFYDVENYIWYLYVFFNIIEACRLVHKIYIRWKNSYRRNIANMEIGADNLRKIFEKVRNELDKKKVQ